MWKNDDCPCTRDCPDRWVSVDGSKPLTCHGTCPRYEAWVEKRNAEKKEQAIRAERYAITDSQQKAIWRSRRRNQPGVYKKFPS